MNTATSLIEYVEIPMKELVESSTNGRSMTGASSGSTDRSALPISGYSVIANGPHALNLARKLLRLPKASFERHAGLNAAPSSNAADTPTSGLADRRQV
jgi:hypothetical protein